MRQTTPCIQQNFNSIRLLIFKRTGLIGCWGCRALSCFCCCFCSYWGSRCCCCIGRRWCATTNRLANKKYNSGTNFIEPQSGVVKVKVDVGEASSLAMRRFSCKPVGIIHWLERFSRRPFPSIVRVLSRSPIVVCAGQFYHLNFKVIVELVSNCQLRSMACLLVQVIRYVILIWLGCRLTDLLRKFQYWAVACFRLCRKYRHSPIQGALKIVWVIFENWC